MWVTEKEKIILTILSHPLEWWLTDDKGKFFTKIGEQKIVINYNGGQTTASITFDGIVTPMHDQRFNGIYYKLTDIVNANKESEAKEQEKKDIEAITKAMFSRSTPVQ